MRMDRTGDQTLQQPLRIALDIGGGKECNSHYRAEQDLDVTAMGLTSDAIERLIAAAAQHKLSDKMRLNR